MPPTTSFQPHIPSPPCPRQPLVDAADQLNKSDRGHGALVGLHKALPHLCSLDSHNRTHVLTLLQGFFGDYPGTVLEIVRAEAEEEEPDIMAPPTRI